MTPGSLACGLLLGVLTGASLAVAQSAKLPTTIGLLCVGDCPAPPLESTVTAFVNTLRDAGYVDGENVVVDLSGVGDAPNQLPRLATRLVSRKVHVIVAMGTDAVLAAKQASNSIPIVMLDVPNAVELRLIASLARPGGNVTGVTFPLAEVSAKQMELLKQIVPAGTSVGILWNPATLYADLARKHAETAARSVGLQVQSLEVRGASDLDRAFSVVARERTGALLVVEDLPLSRLRRDINLFALEKRMPVLAWSRQFSVGGGLMSFGPSRTEMHRLAATVAVKILKGRRPADIPVEQPTRYELVVNLGTAKAIGVTVPPGVLAGADEILQ